MELDAARGTVRAHVVRAALDLLMEIAAPMHVQVALDASGMQLTTHGEGPWWATVTIPATEVTGAAAASVPRLELRQAVDAEALLVPEATCTATVVTDDVLRYGGFALAATEPDPRPPGPAGPSVRIELAPIVDGRGETPDGRRLTVPAPSLDRFGARGIETADVVDGPDGPYLVGRAASDGGSTTMEVVLVARAEWSG